MNDQRGNIRVKPQGHRPGGVPGVSPHARRTAGAIRSTNYVN
ncbi:hypothetical protein ACWDGI_10140 [Streptomyces sp. NPDC001220]